MRLYRVARNENSEVLVNDHFLILSKNLEIRSNWPNFGIGQNHSFGRKYRKWPKKKWPDFQSSQFFKKVQIHFLVAKSFRQIFQIFWPHNGQSGNPGIVKDDMAVENLIRPNPGWWLNRNENMHFLCWLSTIFEAIPPRLCSIFTYFALNMNENGISNMKTGPLWVEYVFFKHFLG